MRFIEDFKDNENIVGHYLCKSRVFGKSKTGKTYLSLKLADKTGMIDAKVWELNNNIQSFEEGDFIKIDADTNVYQNEIQLKINKVRRSMEGEYDHKDYIPCSLKDIETMFTQLTTLIKSIQTPSLRQLLENIFIKDEEVKKKFKTHSAAKNMHHSYMGGLLEHTLSVVQICDILSAHYEFVNRDLLMTAAMMHDIGKIYELSQFPENDYTDIGQLIGHIVMGSEMVTKYSSDIIGFPEELKLLLRHCILAHHGEFEFGSPKLPHIMEAVILHAADNMDARVMAFREAVTESTITGNWLGYNKIFQRNIRKSDIK